MAFSFGKKQVLIYGGFFFLVECIFAVVFYRERLFSDSAYYFLHTVNSGWFRIDHQRFILAFAELLPFIGSHIGLPLKALLIVYSLNHVFFFLALFLVLVHRNDLNGALAITALLTFNALNLFVNPMLEIWYGAGFAVLLFSFLQKDILTKKDYLWIGLLEITILFSHPENFILVFFLTLLDIQKRKAFCRVHLIMLFIFIASGIYKYLTLDTYESAKIGWDFKVINKYDYLNLLHGDYDRLLGALLVRYYWILLLLLAVSSVKYVVSGKYLRWCIVLFTFTGTIVLLNVIAVNNVLTHYGSVMYMPIVSIAVIPFFYDTFGSMKGKMPGIVFLLFVLLTGFRLYSQLGAVSSFTERVNQMNRIISVCDKIGGNKFFVNSSSFAKPYSRVGWSYPMETLLLSAERGKNMCRSIATNDDTTEVKAKAIFTDSSIFMLRRWDIVHDNELNQKYFHAEKGIYKTVDYKE